jgi:phospholipase C
MMHRARMGHLAGMLAVGWLIAGFGGFPAAGAGEPLQQINYVIVIYQENHSFDNYFGTFPGADGVANAGATATQVDHQGRPYRTLPQPLANPRIIGGQAEPRAPDPRFPADLPNRPFLFNQFVSPGEVTANLIHAFYRNQYQIHGGKMDQFVAWTDAGSLVMGYWDLSGLPLSTLAQEYTLADRFFQAAFGGSLLNHQWLICACTPTFPDAPQDMRSMPFPDDPDHLQDKAVTPDGYVVNHVLGSPAFSVNHPHPPTAKPEHLVPNQTAPTIGDRLSAAGVSWAWYAGGWHDALAGHPPERFGFHHQPFVYFANYADGTAAKARHLKDETEFLVAVHEGTLPAVSFVKPVALDTEHPFFATVRRGQEHVAELVRAVQGSRYWNEVAILITYDENGGYWDHVPPPVIDRWGPGPRVPAVIVSPWAKRGYIDHTTYDTTSILKFIETRWQLAPLGTRDAAAYNLTNAFTGSAAAR